jgi:twitching motility protein PilT
MSLAPSLLQAIVRLDGDALVMHVGDKPYVVSAGAHIELATRALSLESIVGVASELLTPQAQRTLDEIGAVEYELPRLANFPGERFTIVAARGGDDVWVEVRRRTIGTAGRVAPPAAAGAAPQSMDAAPGLATPASIAPAAPAVLPVAAPAEASALAAVAAPEIGGIAAADIVSVAAVVVTELAAGEAQQLAGPGAPASADAAADDVSAMPAVEDTSAAPADVTVSPSTRTAVRDPRPAARVEPAAAVRHPAAELELRDVRPRASSRGDVPPPLAAQALAGLDRLLRLAAARGASTLYLSSGARPSARIDGEVCPLDAAPILDANEVESLLLTLMPQRSAEALRAGVATEWISELPEVGRVRCLTFRDQRGPGAVFRIMPGRPFTVEQLGLSRDIQSLALEPEGLLLVTGPRSSGKRTLISAVVDLINRARREHVISIESEINVVHERGGCFVSQREVRGGIEEMAAVARAALREDPDVLVLENLRSAAMMDIALEAAGSGHLVIGGFAAHNAAAAIDGIIDLYPPGERRRVQLSLAQSLCGVVAQVLLRKSSGGRVAAREVLLSTPAVASVLAEGKTSQLPVAIEGGRRHGMVPLNDALVGFVQSGVVEAREAYTRAVDRAGFLALLKRQGIDTSALER